MPGRQYSPPSDTHAYIPQATEQAMTQHLQSSLPAHLRQYVGQERPAYVPERIERELTQQMQKNMPAHLQQYSSAYLQQKVVKPGLVGLDPYHSKMPLPSRPPTPDRLRLGHSMPTNEQFAVQVQVPTGATHPEFTPGFSQQPSQGTLLAEAPLPSNPVQPDTPQSYAPTPGQTPPPTQPPQPYAQQPVAYPPNAPSAPQPVGEYGFIMSPEAPKRNSWSLPGSGSQVTRMLTVFGGLFMLLIVFLVIKGFLGGGSSLLPFTTIVQDQQELIHLATSLTQQQQTASTTSQNIAGTVQLSLTSAQSQLLTYLADNHQKVGTKVLNLKVSTSLDTELTNAAANSTYDQTFQQLIQSKLTTYQQDLKRAYNETKGAKGHQLLSNDYNGATLLLKQITLSAN